MTIVQQYSPYGSAIYGQTTYGPPPSLNVTTTLTAMPPPANIGLYNSLFINWTLPSGSSGSGNPINVGNPSQPAIYWTEMKLVRSSFGIPVTPDAAEGVTLLDQTAAPFSISYMDTGLQSGRFYYYSLFVYTSQEGWLFCAGAQGLCLTDFQYPEIYTSWTPNWYLEQDDMLNPPDPLQRFYGLVGFETNWLRSEIETIFTLSNAEYISGSLLPLLGGNVGMEYESALGMQRSRVLIGNAASLYKIKGTNEGIEDTANALSGYGCEITISPNLEIQLDDAAFARSTGHWEPQNASSQIGLVSAASYLTTPQHAAYTPIQGNSGLSGIYSDPVAGYDINGYLPVDGNENVALLTGASTQQYAWAENLPTAALPSIPAGRIHAALACDYVHNQFLLFGGQGAGPGNPWLNDTWLWTGTVWQRLNPQTAPSVLQNPVMKYDPAHSNILLFGYNAATYHSETWTWNQTNWTFANSRVGPTSDYALSPAKFYGTPWLWLIGYNFWYNRVELYVWANGVWNWANPPPFNMRGISAAYDWHNELMVVTGGFNPKNTAQTYMVTWIFDGTNWTNELAGGPAVGGGPMAFNGPAVEGGSPNSHVVMLDANGYLWYVAPTAGTWSWTQISSGTNQPTPARGATAMAYDQSPNQLILYGGLASAGTNLGDTWIYGGNVYTVNGSTWTLNLAQTAPQPRIYGAMAFNGGAGRTYLFSGASATNQLLSDLWSWSGTAWTLASSGSPPSPRHSAAMCYTTGSLLLVYGGDAAQPGAATPNVFSDLWQWNAGATPAWTQITETGNPTTGRAGHMMVWDPTAGAGAGRLIIFGGYNNTGLLGDTWHVSPAGAWTQHTPAVSPPPRSHGSFEYVGGGISVLFGGEFGPNNPADDTWLYNSSTLAWTQVSYGLAPHPSARHSAATVFIPSMGMAVFGGQSIQGEVLSDAWYFNSAVQDWSPIFMTNPQPLPRRSTMAAFNTTNQTMVLYGGIDAQMNVLGDTWTFSIQAATFAISECDPTCSTTLGIPAQAGQTYVLSAYFQAGQPGPGITTIVNTRSYNRTYNWTYQSQTSETAPPIVRQFYVQLDWYAQNGALLSSVQGTAVTEGTQGGWARASVVGTAPTGTAYLGRTVGSPSNLTGATDDQHLMDAVQTEVNTQLTPGPSSWTPPRDIQINLLPNRQNLAINTQGLPSLGATPYGGVPSYGWTVNNGTMVAQQTGVTWPLNLEGGWNLTADGTGTINFVSYSIPVGRLIFGGDDVVTSGGDEDGYYCETFFASFYLKAAATPAGSWNIVFNFYDQNSALITTSQSPVTVSGTAWTTVALSQAVTPPSNALTMTVGLTGTGLGSGAVYNMAAPLIEPASALLPFFDGSTANVTSPYDYSFEGTPNVSYSDYYPCLEPRVGRLCTAIPDYVPIGSTFSVVVGAAAAANAAAQQQIESGVEPGPPIDHSNEDVIQCTGSINFGAVTTAPVAFANATTLGNTLVAVIGTGNTSVVGSIGGLGTWARADRQTGCEIWYCLDCTTSGTTATIHWSAAPSTSATACLFEIPTCTALDIAHHATGSAAGAQGPPTLTPTARGDFFVAGLNTNGTPSAVNGHMAAMNNTGDLNVVYQFQRMDQQNSYTPAWTVTAGAWQAVGAAFKVANPRAIYNVTNHTAFVTAEQYPEIDVYEAGFHVFRMALWGADDNGSALSPDRTRLWQTINVPSTNCGALQIIDTASMTGIYAIQYPNASPTDPVALCFSPDGTKVYCANAVANTVTVYNAQTYALLATIPTDSTCHRLAITPDGTKLYAVNGHQYSATPMGTVSVINTATNTVTNTVVVAADLWEAVFTLNGQNAYLAGGSGNCVYMLNNTDTVTGSIRVGGGAHGLGLTPDGSHLYVSNFADGTVDVISTVSNTVVAGPIPAGPGAATTRVTRDGTQAWTANNNGNTVTVISTASNTVIGTLAAGVNPNGLSL